MKTLATCIGNDFYALILSSQDPNNPWFTVELRHDITDALVPITFHTRSKQIAFSVAELTTRGTLTFEV